MEISKFLNILNYTLHTFYVFKTIKLGLRDKTHIYEVFLEPLLEVLYEGGLTGEVLEQHAVLHPHPVSVVETTLHPCNTNVWVRIGTPQQCTFSPTTEIKTVGVEGGSECEVSCVCCGCYMAQRPSSTVGKERDGFQRRGSRFLCGLV